jgi:hypothetical protein
MNKTSPLWLTLALALSGCTSPTQTPGLPTLAPTLAQPTASLSTPDPAPTEALAPEAEATAFAAAVLVATPEQVESSAAPDGLASAELWTAPCETVAGFESYGPVGYHEIRWRGSPNSTPELVARQIVICQGLGAGGLRVVQWSADSRYLFYTDAAQGTPDGAGCPWFGRVLRWDTTDRTSTSLGNGATSPDGNWVAGVTGGEVTIWSWNSDEVKRSPVIEPNWPVSAIGWAPDGRRVLFVQSDNSCGLSGSSVIGLLDSQTGAVTELLRTQDPALLNFRFESVDELTFYGTSPDPHRFRLVGDDLVALP